MLQVPPFSRLSDCCRQGRVQTVTFSRARRLERRRERVWQAFLAEIQHALGGRQGSGTAALLCGDRQ